MGTNSKSKSKPEQPASQPTSTPKVGPQIRISDIETLIDTLKGGQYSLAEAQIKKIDITKENHKLLKHFLLFEPYCPSTSKEIISIILKAGGYEKHSPTLSLKAYAFLGDKQKIREAIQRKANPNSTSLTFKNFMADLMVEERPEIISFLANMPISPKPEMGSALMQACEKNLPKTVKEIFKYKDHFCITPQNIRDMAYHAIVKGNDTFFKLACHCANSNSLQTWKTHFQSMHKEALKDPIKRKYTKEIKIINNSLARLKLKNIDYDTWNLQI
jgi:hypothetical protein